VAGIDHDAILKKARADLMLSTARGDADVFLWEHSCRVAESARCIAKLPEVAARNPDETAVFVAALYHDAGWAVRCRQSEIDRMEMLLSPTTEAACEHAAILLEKSLAALLPPDTLERALRAVRLRLDRAASLVEAEIVAEAENLDEFGIVPLWTAIRRGLLDGKGVQAVLDSWRRKQEYQFWSARLHDSFRFAATRDLARRRLDSMERLMQALDEQQAGRDIVAAFELRGAPAAACDDH